MDYHQKSSWFLEVASYVHIIWQLWKMNKRDLGKTLKKTPMKFGILSKNDWGISNKSMCYTYYVMPTNCVLLKQCHAWHSWILDLEPQWNFLFSLQCTCKTMWNLYNKVLNTKKKGALFGLSNFTLKKNNAYIVRRFKFCPWDLRSNVQECKAWHILHNPQCLCMT